jgi:hypothetical protein
MLSSESKDPETCRNDCIMKCKGSVGNIVGQNPQPNTGFSGGGKRRKSSTFSKGFSAASRRQPLARAKRKATRKRRK